MSTHILQVDSSVLGDQGQSSQLSSQLVAALQKHDPKATKQLQWARQSLLIR